MPAYLSRITILTAILLLAYPVLPASAAKRKPVDSNDGVPVLDIKSTCNEAKNYSGDDMQRSFRGCMEDEMQARQQLKSMWRKFKPKDREHCVASSASVMPSYVEVLTCLEMNQEGEMTTFQPLQKWPVNSGTQNNNPNATTVPSIDDISSRYERAREEGAKTERQDSESGLPATVKEDNKAAEEQKKREKEIRKLDRYEEKEEEKLQQKQ